MAEEVLAGINQFLQSLFQNGRTLTPSMVAFIIEQLPTGTLRREDVESLTVDQLLQLFSTLVAAEKLSTMIQEMTVPQIAESPFITSPTDTEWIWISRRFDAGDTVSRTITGGREMLKLTGPGRVVDAILIASVNTIGLNIMVDDNAMYSGDYTSLLAITRADGKLSAYYDTDLSMYVLKVSDIGFRDQFLFSVSCTGTVTFDVISCSYEIPILHGGT